MVSVGDTVVEPFTSMLPISGSMVQESFLLEAHEDVERKRLLAKMYG